jgi:hypothetical protein
MSEDMVAVCYRLKCNSGRVYYAKLEADLWYASLHLNGPDTLQPYLNKRLGGSCPHGYSSIALLETAIREFEDLLSATTAGEIEHE